MAIYHFSAQTISRGKGQSATASAAYRSGERLYSERYDKTSFYARENQPETFVLKPKHAPDWVLNREQLWNEVERIERHENAQLAREINVALPIELSHKEQRDLAQEYVQKNFVEEGMAADVSIHRDDEHNPHFHVLLTNRPFKENGEWDSKTKTTFLKDKNGNQLYTKGGSRKNKKVHSREWDSKEKMQSWRENWAELTNQYLEMNGFSDRISEKSHAEHGIDKQPTIHEGYAAREMEKRGDVSDRSEINRTIQEQNRSKEQERKQYVQKETQKNISDSLSPNEKKDIRLIAKNLKVYVNYDNLIDKQRMVHNWEKSTEIKAQLNPDKDFESTFNTIDVTKENIQQGKQILEQQFTRIFDKYYPEMNENHNFSTYYKMALTQRTLDEDRVLNEDEIADTIVGARDKKLSSMLQTITKNPYLSSVEKYMNSFTNTVEQLDDFKAKYKVNDDTVHTLNEEQQKEYKTLAKKEDLQYKTIQVLDNYYTNTIESQYPTADINSMELLEKEAVSRTIDYYGNDYDFETILNMADDEVETPNRFTYRQQQLGIQYAYQLTFNHEVDFDTLPKDREVYEAVRDQGMRTMFLEEAKNNGFEEEVSDIQKDPDEKEKEKEQNRGIRTSIFANNLHLLNNLGRANEDNLRREIEERQQQKEMKGKKRGRVKHQTNKQEKEKEQDDDLSL